MGFEGCIIGGPARTTTPLTTGLAPTLPEGTKRRRARPPFFSATRLLGDLAAARFRPRLVPLAAAPVSRRSAASIHAAADAAADQAHAAGSSMAGGAEEQVDEPMRRTEVRAKSDAVTSMGQGGASSTADVEEHSQPAAQNLDTRVAIAIRAADFALAAEAAAQEAEREVRAARHTVNP